MAASAPGYLAGQVAVVSQLLPVRAQRASARQNPARRPGGGDCPMRRSTTLEPNKSQKLYGWHRQLVGDGIGKAATVWTTAIDRGDYAAIVTPVTSAHVVNAWLRAIRNFDAVS